VTETPKIECAKNGPLLAKGLTRLVRLDGTPAEAQATCALCRCGQSKGKPFCDGSHSSAGFDDARSDDRMWDRRKDYAGASITIHDNRGICAHAAFCTERLPGVFRVDGRPWIDPDGAPVDEVVALIESCPSGALSYTIDGVEHRDNDGAEPTVLIAPGGPYAVKGGVKLVGVEFGEGASREHFNLCRCGASENKPFCDGAHWSVDFDENAPDRE